MKAIIFSALLTFTVSAQVRAEDVPFSKFIQPTVGTGQSIILMPIMTVDSWTVKPTSGDYSSIGGMYHKEAAAALNEVQNYRFTNSLSPYLEEKVSMICQNLDVSEGEAIDLLEAQANEILSKTETESF